MTTSLSPTVHAFGDPVEATVDVLVDTREIDLEQRRPAAELRAVRGSRPAAGDARAVRRPRAGPVRYRLVCLKEGCDTAEARGVSDFPSGRLRYRFKDRPGNAFEAFDWPLLEVASRVATRTWRRFAGARASTCLRRTASAARRRARAARRRVRVRCRGVLLARRLWWPKRADEADAGDAADTRSPLEQAFDVALHCADGDRAPERRRALERVARELGATGRTELADEARALAWSPRRRRPRRSRPSRVEPVFRPRQGVARERVGLEVANARPADLGGGGARQRVPPNPAGAVRARLHGARAPRRVGRPRAVARVAADDVLRDRERRYRRSRPLDERRRPEGTACPAGAALARGDGRARRPRRLLRQRLRDAPAGYAKHRARAAAAVLQDGAADLPGQLPTRPRRPDRSERSIGATAREPVVAHLPGRHPDLDRARRGATRDRAGRRSEPLRAARQ